MCKKILIFQQIFKSPFNMRGNWVVSNNSRLDFFPFRKEFHPKIVVHNTDTVVLSR